MKTAGLISADEAVIMLWTGFFSKRKSRKDERIDKSSADIRVRFSDVMSLSSFFRFPGYFQEQKYHCPPLLHTSILFDSVLHLCCPLHLSLHLYSSCMTSTARTLRIESPAVLSQDKILENEKQLGWKHSQIQMWHVQTSKRNNFWTKDGKLSKMRETYLMKHFLPTWLKLLWSHQCHNRKIYAQKVWNHFTWLSSRVVHKRQNLL